MNIEINTEFLRGANLSPSDYVYLMFKYKGIKPIWSPTWARLEYLQALGYVKLLDPSQDTAHVSDDGKAYSVVLRKKFTDLIEGDFDRDFAELVSTYPLKVGTPKKYRVLRTSDPKGQGNKKARDKYKKIVGKTPGKHREIMKGLNNQLEHQRDQLQYMQLLEVWINNATWEKWVDFEIEKDETRRSTVL